MARAAAESFHVGITPDRIARTAQRLTRESNLYGWSIRDLAKELQVTPSVIYHHVGGKDLIAKLISEEVVRAAALPDPALDWQEWFRALLVDSIYPVAIEYPGVAKWLLLHGVPFPSATDFFETGIDKLRIAGAGENAMLAYSAILNNAMLTISMGDERLLHEDDGPRDHAAMMEEFRRAFAEGPGVAKMGAEFIAEFAKGGEAAARMRERYYRYVVEVTLAGVSALITPDSRAR